MMDASNLNVLYLFIQIGFAIICLLMMAFGMATRDRRFLLSGLMLAVVTVLAISAGILSSRVDPDRPL